MPLQIEFAGWFECRLATDPDRFDEKRGVLGWTFALSDEPDLDRIIRFQPAGTVRRFGGPEIGVRVTSVMIGGAVVRGHPLLGASVDLPGAPVFEGRNGQVAGDGEEPIFPFEILVGNATFSMRRSMRDPTTGEPLLVLADGSGLDPPILAAAGIADVVGYRQARRMLLEARLGMETQPERQADLARRLSRYRPMNDAGPLFWGVPAALVVRYVYELRGTDLEIKDEAGLLTGFDAEAPWRAELRLGCFDPDALAGFALGRLSLMDGPTRVA